MKRSILAGTAAMIALASSAYVQWSATPSREPAAPASAQAPPAVDPAPVSVLLTPIARDGTPVGEARRVHLAPVTQGELEHRPAPPTDR